MQFGNKDTENRYDLSHLKDPNGTLGNNYIVRHFDHLTTSKGRQIEDDDSSRIQVYDPKTFAEYSAERTQDVNGQVSQLPSRFAEMSLNVEVLHDPTLNGEKAGKQPASTNNAGNQAPAAPKQPKATKAPAKKAGK